MSAVILLPYARYVFCKICKLLNLNPVGIVLLFSLYRNFFVCNLCIAKVIFTLTEITSAVVYAQK